MRQCAIWVVPCTAGQTTLTRMPESDLHPDIDHILHHSPVPVSRVIPGQSSLKRGLIRVI